MNSLYKGQLVTFHRTVKWTRIETNEAATTLRLFTEFSILSQAYCKELNENEVHGLKFAFRRCRRETGRAGLDGYTHRARSEDEVKVG